MRKFSFVIPLVGALFLSATPAIAQVSIGIGLPGVSIGLNFPVYPQLSRIPGYPVYYAPQLGSNFFFYDGMYWVYEGDNWYASSWYNGPWEFVGPQAVPLFVLRIPVRYYRAPPAYFRGWQRDAPPRWGDHWGNDWAHQRSGWDRWNRGSAPAPAPLPTYQRQYAGDRYPHQVEQQRNIHDQNYRYQPRDAQVRQHEQASPARMAPAPASQERLNVPQQDRQRAPQQETPRQQPQQRSGEDAQRAAPAQAPVQQRGPVDRDQMQAPRQAPEQRQQQAPVSRQAPQEQGHGQGQDKVREQAPVQQRSPVGRDQMQAPRQAPEQRQQQAPQEQGRGQGQDKVREQAPVQQRSPVGRDQMQAPRQAPEQRQQQAPQEQGRGQGQEKERDSGGGQGQGRNK